MRYFIGNWKMFGVPKSIKIAKNINNFIKIDKNRNKYRVILTPPFTLLQNFSNYFKNKKIKIGSQNCYHKNFFSSDTGAISPYMIKKVGCNYSIVGHSDNRAEGDNDIKLKQKVNNCLKNNLKIVYCIGENKTQKNKNNTFKVLKNQIENVIQENISSQNFSVDISNETLDVTTLTQLSTGYEANIETSLSVSDKLGGHIVSGHVDCIAQVINIEEDSRSFRVGFELHDKKYLRYIVKKGSICVDGVSLTVNMDSDNGFFVNIIPFTWDHTIIKYYKISIEFMKLYSLNRYLSCKIY